MNIYIVSEWHDECQEYIIIGVFDSRELLIKNLLRLDEFRKPEPNKSHLNYHIEMANTNALTGTDIITQEIINELKEYRQDLLPTMNVGSQSWNIEFYLQFLRNDNSYLIGKVYDDRDYQSCMA